MLYLLVSLHKVLKYFSLSIYSIQLRYNNEGRLGEIDTHRKYFNMARMMERNYVMSLCKWVSDQGMGRLVKKQTLQRAAKD